MPRTRFTPTPRRATIWVLGVLLTLVVLTAPASAQAYRQHTVQPGETLAIIADIYNTTWSEIAALNRLTNPNLIYNGQVLVIPAAGIVVPQPTIPPTPTTGTVYTIVRGDTLTTIAQRFGTTVDAIIANNSITNSSIIYAGQTLRIPTAVYVPPVVTPPTYHPPVVNNRYIVQPGDTMFKISARFGVNIYDIARANGILNLNHIYAGQALIIPG